MLVIRTELQPRERLLRSPGLFTLSIMLTSAALGSGVAAGYPELRILLHTLTDSRSSGRMVLARKMKSCLDGITTIARDFTNRNAISRPKIKVF